MCFGQTNGNINIILWPGSLGCYQNENCVLHQINLFFKSIDIDFILLELRNLQSGLYWFPLYPTTTLVVLYDKITSDPLMPIMDVGVSI